MKRLLLSWLVVSLMLGLSLYLGRDFFAELLRRKIESSAQKAGVELRIGHLALSFQPLGLQLENVHVDIPRMMSADLKDLTVSLSLSQVFEQRLGLELLLRDAKMQWLLADTESGDASAESAATAPKPSSQNAGLPFALSFKMVGQRISVKVLKGAASVAAVQASELKVSTATLMDPQSPWSLDFAGDIEYLAMTIPTQVHVPALFVSGTEFKGETIDAAVLGLTSQWNVSGALDGSQVKADGHVTIADLKTVPKAAFVGGVESLEGSLNAQISAEMQKPNPLSVTALIKSPKFAVGLNRQQGAQKMKGVARGAVDIDIAYVKNQLQVRQSQLNLDLEGLDIDSAPYFQKATGVVLALEATARGTQDQINVSKLDIRLANAVFANRLIIKDVLKDAQVQFETELMPVELIQLGQLSPMTKQYPLAGQVAAKATGSLLAKEPMRGSIQLQRLSLQNVRGALNLEKPAFKTKGPFRLNLEASSVVQSGSVRKLDAKGEFAHGPIQLKFAGLIKDLQTFVGSFIGQISSIEALTKMLPTLTGLRMDGTGDFKIQLAGPLELTKAPLDWALKTTGGAHLKLGRVQLVSTAPASTVSAPASPSPAKVGVAVRPFLEKHTLFDGLNIRFSAELAEVETDQLRLQNLQLKSAVSAHGLRGDFAVGQIFGGKVKIADMFVNPFQTKGFFSGDIDFSRVNVSAALKFLKPEFANMITGFADGKITVSCDDPRTESFLPELRAQGQMILNQAVLKSLPLVEMAHGILSKIPGAVQGATAQAKDVPMTARMVFVLANKIATLKPFNAVTERQDDLNLNGTLSLDMMANLQGEFKLAQPPVGGSFLAANQDEKGRLVLPLQIEGSLLSPKVAFLGATLDKMARKTLEFEKNKAIQKATESVKKSVEDEVKKQLKGIFGQ